MPKYIMLLIMMILAVMFSFVIISVSKLVDLSVTKEYNVEYLHRPLYVQDAMLSFLETTYPTGVRVLDLLDAVAASGSEIVYIDGKVINVTETVQYVLTTYLKNYRFTLSSDSGTVISVSTPELSEKPGFAETFLMIDGKIYRITLYGDGYE